MTRNNTTAKVLHLRYRFYKGMYARIARELGVTRSVVSRVGKGVARSRRIETALQREMQRIERKLEKIVEDNAA